MSKSLPWILVAVLVVINIGDKVRLSKWEEGVWALANAANGANQRADSLQGEVTRRDVLIEALNAAEANRQRERDSAQVSWKPVQQEQDAFVLHFDTAGIGAAIDSLNARPIGF